MTRSVEEVMEPHPVCLTASTNVAVAASAMRDAHIGDVIVERDGVVCGILTDRDIVVRVVAEGKAPKRVAIGEICSRELTSLAPSDPIEMAVQLMRDKALRRLPVVEGGRAVGIVSLGDLARAQDPHSALAAISGAPANR